MIRRVWLVAMLALGCAGAPAPSAPPSTDQPTAPTPAETPSALPTAVPPTVSASPSPTGSPARPNGIVLRMHHTGGHLYPGMAIDAAPSFTLYADGTVIYRPSTVPLYGPDLPAGGLRRAVMDQEQMDALVAFALGPGGLADAGERYADVPVADLLTTNFAIDAAGVNKAVGVYGLGDEMGPTAETPHRERFMLLADLLGSFEDEIERGNATDAGEFEPTLYRVTIIADEFGEVAPSGEWLWEHLSPDDFARDQSGFGVRLLTPGEMAPLFEVPPAEIGDPVMVGPDEVNYLIRHRPLLPDEVDHVDG